MKFTPAKAGLAIFAASCIAAAPAIAQDSSAPAEAAPVAEAASVAPEAAAPAAPPPACELHIFPTLEGQAMTTGWLSGFGIVGAVADAASNKNRNISDADYLKDALGPQMQIDALNSINVVEALKLPPSQVIFETPIADRKITTKAATRLSTSKAPCYVELVITQNFYTKKAIYGRSLNNRFIVKDFRTGKDKAALVKGRGGNGLSHFPPKTTDETEAAETELREVFVKNFIEFAKGVK
ncbi:hypothetical protein ATE67_17265 [Sphingopyxis sp. H050]|jgi:hypothetical protein|uniref:hypothetical protein n=1 Tax=Sphingopyxis sp. H050 TaxID=1759072 RepID=UPI00073715C8|nr:hypothetical protein [Sphingopyxis sp. H050]KTE18836.1 hypothetical protein ATE67_17265 [Sphingopyxis sp. H050]